jgi:hypothetical protein
LTKILEHPPQASTHIYNTLLMSNISGIQQYALMYFLYILDLFMLHCFLTQVNKENFE